MDRDTLSTLGLVPEIDRCHPLDHDQQLSTIESARSFADWLSGWSEDCPRGGSDDPLHPLDSTYRERGKTESER